MASPPVASRTHPRQLSRPPLAYLHFVDVGGMVPPPAARHHSLAAAVGDHPSVRLARADPLTVLPVPRAVAAAAVELRREQSSGGAPGRSPGAGRLQRPGEAPPRTSRPPTSCCSLSTALVTPSWPSWWYRLVMVSLRFSLSSAFSWGEGGTAAALVEDSEVGQGGSGRRPGWRGMQEDSGKGWGQGMGIGCWLRRVVVGPGGWESPRGPWAGSAAAKALQIPWTPAFAEQAAWVRRASWRSLWSTLHLWPRPHLQAQHRSLYVLVLPSLHACVPLHGRSSRACPTCACGPVRGCPCPYVYVYVSCTLVSSSLHVCPCTSTSSGGLSQPSPAGSRRRPGPPQ